MLRRLPLLMLTLALLGVSVVSRPESAGATIFNRDVLTNLSTSPTSIAFGPDARLYVASQAQIVALTLDASGENVVSTQTIVSGESGILGIAFDPTAPASPVEIYASRQNLGATDGYEGVVSTYTAGTRVDVITGLPSSRPHTNHFTNGLAFNSSGRLFLAQGSNTDAGLQTPYYPETPLSAAILYADVNAMGFNGIITYNPATMPTTDSVVQTGGDVFVFAPGTRNPYDLVVHSNGYIYASDNGPGGPNTSTSCTTSGSGGLTQSDELNLIKQNNYYGFPNRNRGLAGDTRQCTYHSAESGSGVDFTGPIQVLPAHCSCDGLAEYTSPVMGTGWQGNLLLAQFILGDVARIVLAGDGRSVLAVATLESGFSQPLDVAVGPDGTIYVAEYGANRISYLAPAGKTVGGMAGVPDVRSGSGNLYWVLLASIALAAAAAAVAGGRRALRR